MQHQSLPFKIIHVDILILMRGTFAIILQDSCGLAMDVLVADAVPPCQSIVFSEVPKYLGLFVVIVTQGSGALYLFEVSRERFSSPSQHLDYLLSMEW